MHICLNLTESIEINNKARVCHEKDCIENIIEYYYIYNYSRCYCCLDLLSAVTTCLCCWNKLRDVCLCGVFLCRMHAISMGCYFNSVI